MGINNTTPQEWDSLKQLNTMQERFDKNQATYNQVGRGFKEKSDGLHAEYYTLPKNATQLQDLISNRNMNAQIGEIFRECYRYGLASHSDELRGIKKILFYANAELKRLENAN